MNHDFKVKYNSDLGHPVVTQYNFDKNVEFYNERPDFVFKKIDRPFIRFIVARFHLRNLKTIAAILLVIVFASCKKSSGVEFTTFNGVPAGVYTVTVEAQQDNAASIWSPVSSITIAK